MLQDEGLLGKNSFQLLQLLADHQDNHLQTVDDWSCSTYASSVKNRHLTSDNNDDIGAVVGFAVTTIGSAAAARSTDSFNSEGNNSCTTSLSDCCSTTKSLSNTTREPSMSSSITTSISNKIKGEEEQKQLVEAIQGWPSSLMQGSNPGSLLHHAMNQNLPNYPQESLQDLLYSTVANPLLAQDCRRSEDQSSSRLEVDYNMQYSWGQQQNPALMGHHHFVPKMEMDTWSTTNATVAEQTGLNLQSPCPTRQKDIRRVKEEEEYSQIHALLQRSSPQQGSSGYGYLDTTNNNCSSSIRPMFKTCNMVDQIGLTNQLPSPRFPVTPNLNYRQIFDASSHYGTNNLLFRSMSSPQDDHYYGAPSPIIERKPSTQEYMHQIYGDTKPSTRIGGMAYGVEMRNTSVDSKAPLLPPESSSPFKRPRVEPSPPSNSVVQKTQPRKEKVADRIAALQQLVSPFGKTDTASVLTEAIKYINFLHNQAKVLSTPYLRSSTTTTSHMQEKISTSPSSSAIEGNEGGDEEEAREDLRSRGLCLVPLSRTMHIANDAAPDYWPPTLAGIFR